MFAHLKGEEQNLSAEGFKLDEQFQTSSLCWKSAARIKY